MPVVDLFCGCGGLSRGFEDAGFDIIAAFDGWQSAITCYNANFGHEAVLLDLSNVAEAVTAIQPFAPNIIIGGPPCQEFSNAGRREEGAIADLTYKYSQIVSRIHPQYFVMENVPRVRESKAYQKARALYKESGYGLTEVVLDASKCGVPQKRNRFFCIGSIGAEDGFLMDSIFEEYMGLPITVRKYFNDHDIPIDIDNYYRHPTTYKRRGVFSIDAVAPTIRGVNRPKPATYAHHPNDTVEEAQLDNVRQLTLAERAHIQTFPVDFTFDHLDIANGDLEQMVGNAVPVTLANFVATRLHDYIEGANAQMDNHVDFSSWLRDTKRYSDRSISDVFSRIQRAKRILPNHEITRYFMADLERQQEYQNLEVSVRSQIKKAISLRIAFDEQQNANG